MAADGPSIMLAAGEASGDLHGAALCQALRTEAPGCRLFGMGGQRMAAAGMELLVDVTAAAAAGGTEALNRRSVSKRRSETGLNEYRLIRAIGRQPQPLLGEQSCGCHDDPIYGHAIMARCPLHD